MWASSDIGNRTRKDGTIYAAAYLQGTQSTATHDKAELAEKYDTLDEAAARALWEAENAARPKTYTETVHMVSGTLLPVWDRVPGWIRVARAQTDDARRVLGRIVDAGDLPNMMRNLGVTSSASKMPAPEVLRAIMDGNKVGVLANGWRLERARVGGENRLEVRAGPYLGTGVASELRGYGAFIERIAWQERAFLPADKPEALAALLKVRPLADLAGKGESSAAPMSRAPEGVSARAVTPEEATAAVRTLRERLPGLPNIHVLRSLDDAPAALARDIRDKGAEHDVEGAWHDGEVYLFARNIAGAERALWVGLHEATHHGLRAVFGIQLDALLLDIYLGNADIQARAAAKIAKAPYLSKVAATEEVLADMGGDGLGGLPQAILDKLIAFARRVLRELGFDVKLAEAQVREIVRSALAYSGARAAPRTHLAWSAAGQAARRAQALAGLETRLSQGNELDALRARYAGTPLWMRAPNGKPTKLNERQWLQVRTRAFKAWFGDWESLGQQEFLNDEPIASLSGEEVPHFEKIKLLEQWVTKWYADHVGGRANNPLLGEILLDYRAVKNSVAHGLNAYKAAAFVAIPQVLGHGRIVYIDRGRGGRGSRTDSYTLMAPLAIAGRAHVVSVVVNRDANTQRMYVHDVRLKEKLQEHLQSGASAKGAMRSGSDEPGAIVSLGRHIFSVKDETVSKVVDANGEPLVVYHGTRADFGAFDPSRAGQNFGDEDERGMLFSSKPAEPNVMAREAGGNVMPVFLALRDPLIVQTDARLARARFGVDSATTWYDNYKAEILAQATDRKADGIIIEAADHATYVAFEPQQIKSAIGNRGTFDTGNDDIRYSRASLALGADLQRLKAKRGLIETPLAALSETLMLPRATRGIWNFLARFGNAVVPETWKAGLVSDYGLSEAVVDRRDMMFARQRQELRRAEGLLGALPALTREQLAVLYAAANEADAAAVDEMIEALPEQARATLHALKRLVHDLGVEQVRLGLLSKEAFERNEWAYLHRSYAKYDLRNPDNELTPGERRTRARAIAIWGDSYKGRGISDDVAMSKINNVAPEFWQRKLKAGKADVALVGKKFIRFERRANRGEGAGVLPGMEATGQPGRLLEAHYWPAAEPVPAKYADWHNAGTWEARDTKGDKLIMWRDYTAQERQQMGEIEDFRYAALKTLHASIHNVEVGRYFEWLAATEALPKDKLLPGVVVVKANENLFKSYAKDTWVRVPESDLAGTDTKRYGKLAGLYVPGAVWNDIRQLANERIAPLGETYGTVLRAWKISKTALSPAVHMSNIMANVMLADWHDIGARHLLGALRTMLRQGTDPAAAKLIADFEDAGGSHGMWVLSEVQRDQLRPLLDDLERQMANQSDANSLVGVSAALQAMLSGKLREAWTAAAGSKPARLGAKGIEKMMDTYNAEDVVFRLGAFIKAREDGLSDAQAGRFARRSFMDYHITAPWIQLMRHTAFPFISFTYRALPLLLDTAVNRPHKLLKLALVMGMLNAIGYALSGGNEDRERRRLPPEKQGRILAGVAPKLLRMPWNDAQGSPVFLDIRRFVPLGDIVDLGAGHAAVPILPALMPGGPLMIAGELLFNRSVFTGRDIVKDTDTAAETYRKALDHLYKAGAPNFVALPGTWAFQGVADAGSGKTDVFGRERSLPQALGSSVGIKLQAYPQDVALHNARIEYARATRELRGNIYAHARQLRQKGIDKEEYRARVAGEVVKLREMQAQMRERFAP